MEAQHRRLLISVGEAWDRAEEARLAVKKRRTLSIRELKPHPGIPGPEAKSEVRTGTDDLPEKSQHFSQHLNVFSGQITANTDKMENSETLIESENEECDKALENKRIATKRQLPASSGKEVF